MAIAFADDRNLPESFVTWLGIGVGAIVLGIAISLLRRVSAQAALVDTKRYGPACMVISPIGIGLAQGEMQGKLRWDEISGIKNGPNKSFGGSKHPALHVSFAGGVIKVLDIYDRSLVEIASLITSNTQHPPRAR